MYTPNLIKFINQITILLTCWSVETEEIPIKFISHPFVRFLHEILLSFKNTVADTTQKKQMLERYFYMIKTFHLLNCK